MYLLRRSSLVLGLVLLAALGRRVARVSPRR